MRIFPELHIKIFHTHIGIYFSVSAAGDKRETRWQVTEALAKGTRVGFSEALAKKRGTGLRRKL